MLVWTYWNNEQYTLPYTPVNGTSITLQCYFGYDASPLFQAYREITLTAGTSYSEDFDMYVLNTYGVDTACGFSYDGNKTVSIWDDDAGFAIGYISYTTDIDETKNPSNTVLFKRNKTRQNWSPYTPASSEAASDLLNLINQIYPIGSIYITMNQENPSNIWSGTQWEQIKDRFLLAVGNTYQQNQTGGSAAASIVSHTHTFDKTSTSITTDSINLSHNHGINSSKK